MQKEYENYLSFLKQQDSVKYGNHIWLKEGYLAKKQYQEDIFNYLNGDIENLQFNTPEAADTVNGWVSNMTNGKIDKEYYFTDAWKKDIPSKQIYLNHSKVTYLGSCE